MRRTGRRPYGRRVTISTFLRRAALPATTLAFAAAAAPASAADGSLGYVKDGNVHLASPDGSRAKQLTTDGGYAWPSQADDGTVVAVRQTEEGGRKPRRLHRMDRAGKALNAPVETVPVDNSFYIGPLAPKVSPDGRFVAYHYFYTGPITESTLPRTSISHSDRNTINGEITSTLGGYFTPSWLQDGRLLAFYASERTFQIDIWNPDDSVTNWFADPEVAPLLTDGEVSRAGDRMAAVANNTIRLYQLPGAPPAQPQLRCVMSGFSGEVSDPTWSPDGRTLAWEEPDGIHVAELADLGTCGGAARPLVVPGGQDPDWGVVGMGGASGGGGSAALRLSGVPRSAKLASVKRRGLTVKARCAQACSLSARLTAGKARIGAGSAKARAGRTASLRVRLTKAGAARLGRAKKTDATLTVTATGGAKQTRRITLRR